MFQKGVVGKIKTHIVCSTTISECRVVYDTMWKKMVGPH